jgi:hypothetical protein
VVERGGHNPSPVIHPFRSSYRDERAFRFLTASMAFTACRTFGAHLDLLSTPFFTAQFTLSHILFWISTVRHACDDLNLPSRP